MSDTVINRTGSKNKTGLKMERMLLPNTSVAQLVMKIANGH
ncbi:MAG: hypothetical protein NTV47_05390 [Actinobacteria bacterium]|nr:hypothetical protein [Actinomycetota bacterium]